MDPSRTASYPPENPQDRMSVVSIILPLRDMEGSVASLVRSAARVAAHVTPADDEEISMEILALDQRSGDNTLSVLSVLHAQIPNLRTLQDIELGTAIGHAARLARGDAWLLLDHPIEPALAGWAVSQILSGQRAAVVPGELLAVERTVGGIVLTQLTGGLVSAHDAVVRYLRGRGETPAFSPPPIQGPLRRARLLLRGSLGRLGLTRFDRPPKTRE